MKSPKAPAAPDPKQTSAAQTGTSVATALANTALGNVSRVGPTGSLSYDKSGAYSFKDPYTGKSYNLPMFTATEKLSPQQQQIFDQTQGAEYGMAKVANQSSAKLGDILGTTFKPQTGPESIKTTYSTDFSADRKRVEQAMLDRMRPEMDRDKARMETDLANRGVGMGSMAYGGAQDDFSRAQTDARLGAVLAGGQEQSRLVGMEADRAAFGNNAQEQRLSQELALRNQPLNEILALLSGTQVQMPNFPVNQGGKIATTDNAGLIGQQYGADYNAYAQKVNQQNQMTGGLMGLAGSAIGGAGAAGGFGKLFKWAA